MKKALVTGITGQDGSYLTELLLEKGYIVYGLVRRSSSSNLFRIKPLLNNNNLILLEGDLSDFSSLKNIIKKCNPDEIYNLGAMSHVRISFEMPEYSADVNGVGVLRLLESIRSINPNIKFYQASTSELFGKVQAIPQNENTPFYPRSPYGVSKLFGYWTVVNYRESYNLFACNGILFNHESPRRGDNFVSKKITLGVSKIFREEQDKLILGNLSSQRDWGYAKDFVKGMWLMLQQEFPKDYVLATGKTTTVRKFVEMCFNYVGIDIVWEGQGVNEKGIDQKTKKVLVEVSEKFFRPAEVDLLIGDSKKAEKELNWKAETTLEELANIMMEADLQQEELANI
jgi:GDPmannose 4,6-dehydratase